MNPKDGWEQVDGAQSPIRLGDEGRDDIPGRYRVLADGLGNLQEMRQNLEQRVSEFT
jgi:hypothetical protein